MMKPIIICTKPGNMMSTADLVTIPRVSRPVAHSRSDGHYPADEKQHPYDYGYVRPTLIFTNSSCRRGKVLGRHYSRPNDHARLWQWDIVYELRVRSEKIPRADSIPMPRTASPVPPCWTAGCFGTPSGPGPSRRAQTPREKILSPNTRTNRSGGGDLAQEVVIDYCQTVHRVAQVEEKLEDSRHVSISFSPTSWAPESVDSRSK